MSVFNVASCQLADGTGMPQVGLGTWLSKAGEVGEAVSTALTLGYRHFDCAQAYMNQEEVGDALKKTLGEINCKREDIFITSKIWNVFHSETAAADAINQILKDLQLSYVDLLLIHWPQGYLEGSGMFPKDANGVMQNSDVDYLQTWSAMEKAVTSGKVKSIGLSNFNHLQVDRILKEGSIKPVVLQVELHPYLQQEKLKAYCKENGIQVTAYSPLANNTHMFRKEGQPNLLEEEIMKKIGTVHGKSPAQVAIRWSIQKGNVVIPKSVRKERLLENAQVFDFVLSDDEMAQIDTLDRNFRILVLERDLKHPHYPFSAEF